MNVHKEKISGSLGIIAFAETRVGSGAWQGNIEEIGTSEQRKLGPFQGKGSHEHVEFKEEVCV